MCRGDRFYRSTSAGQWDSDFNLSFDGHQAQIGVKGCMFAPRSISYVLSRKQHPLKNHSVFLDKVQIIQPCGLAPRKLLGMSGSSDDCDKVECQNFWLPCLLNCQRETYETKSVLPLTVLEISKLVLRTTSLQYSHALTSRRYTWPVLYKHNHSRRFRGKAWPV